MDRLLTSREAANYIGVTSDTLANLRCKGRGPAFIKTSPTRKGKVLYRVDDIVAWQEANLFNSTSEVEARS
jgi:hypothetical protein